MEEKALLEEHICGLEKLLLSAEVRTSPEKLALLLADDFVEFGSSGRVWHKRDMMGGEGAGVVKMTLSGFELHPLSEEAVLATYRTCNAETGRVTLRSSVWKFRDGRWQMFFHQGTPGWVGD
ncbi:nuclear transport factor 2 family protein [Paenibacillus sp. BAC0078]